MIKKTKIITTIGPATDSDEMLKNLIQDGIDLCRFNLKHNTLAWHKQTIERVNHIAAGMSKKIGIIVDIPRMDMCTQIDSADFVALSYIKSSKEVIEVKQKLAEKKLPIKIIAKIENGEAVRNLDEIIEACDGVMVARGDLGIELPLEELAYWQKKIIDRCRQKNRPVIVATQMLESMVHNPTPTRAEATDVANAIFDGTDAVMLSEETAIGEYPVEAVRELAKIAIFCEAQHEIKNIKKELMTPTEVIIQSAADIIEKSSAPKIKAAIVFSQSGNTARMLSSYRLTVPIIVVSDNVETLDALKISYGLEPFYQNFAKKQFSIEDPLFNDMKAKGLIGSGLVLVIHGNNWMATGATSNISIKEV